MSKNIKSAIIIIIFLAVFVAGVIITKDKYKEPIVKSATQEHFGTIMTITLYGYNSKELETIISNGFEEIDRLENIFSAKIENSELSKLNANAFNQEIKVSDELYQVLEETVKYYELSDGALDVTIGKLISMWGIGTDNERVPKATELADYAGIRGCQYIVMDDAKKTVKFTDKRVQIDLGAIAKGYAADVVKKLINDADSDIYGMLDFGGNIMTIGSKAEGKPWVIGITNPFSVGSAYATINIIDKSVVTSGNYERYFEKDGVRYHHILDPFTGAPSKSGIVSATIIGDNSMQCDALSTATFIMGVDNAIKLIDSIDGVEAMFIDDGGKVYKSNGIDKYNLSIR